MAHLVKESEIENLLLKFYNIIPERLDFFDAYEDVNIKVSSLDASSKNCQFSKFVLKLNKSDINYINFQISMASYLHSRGIQTVTPVAAVDGNIVFRHTFACNSEDISMEMTVCMFHYIPGVTVSFAGNPQSLMLDIGRFTGRMDTALKDFNADVDDIFNDMWELTCLPGLEGLISQYCNEDLRVVAQEIIDTYQRDIAPNLCHFQKGYIHGDVNNCNIIIQTKNEEGQCPKYTIAAIIDFGDACLSYYVYELASVMADLMASTFKTSNDMASSFDAGKNILNGFRECFALNSSELKHLHVVICIRLIQMFVLNSRTVQHNPENEYCCLEIEESGKICEILWRMTDSEFFSKIVKKS